MSMENIQVQKCVNVVFMTLMLSETGPQADKMGYLKQAYIPFVQPRSPDGIYHKKLTSGF